MDEKMFQDTEEDLHEFYHKCGKVDLDMSYRRKLSLNLMIADFIDLNLSGGYKNIMVMLGIDEHKYVRFGQKTIENMCRDPNLKHFDMTLSAMYSPLNRGFNGYPKMSKSFPDSSLRVDMASEDIISRILHEPPSDIPENDIVYQLMASASYYSPKELKQKYLAFLKGGKSWMDAKINYAQMLANICSKWKK
jgi:tryptophanyl-tRNA synthetase